MIKIYFTFFDKISINSLEKLIFFFFKNIQYSIVKLPTKRKRITILKAPHVHKKSKEHYEIFFYKRLLILPVHVNSQFFNFLSFLPNNIRFKVKHST